MASPQTFSAQVSQPELRLALADDLQSVQITAVGATGQLERIEVSTNLVTWNFVALRFNSTGTVVVEDGPLRLDLARFYRARQWPPSPGLQSHPTSGGVGTRVELFGDRFDPLAGDNLVLLGDAIVPILEASIERLLVEIPAGADSEKLRVLRPGGTIDSALGFTLTAELPVDFDLPPGVNPAQFEVVGAYGPAVRSGASTRLTVKAQAPLVAFAVPVAPEASGFYAAVALGANPAGKIRFDSASTAEGLVFLHPLLVTHDMDRALSVMRAIQDSGDVSAFAGMIGTIWPQSKDPFSNPTVAVAYLQAVRSVLLRLAPPRPLGGHAEMHEARASGGTATVAGLDLDYVALRTAAGGGDEGLGAREIRIDPQPYNKVDWFTVIRRLDVDASFPDGNDGFSRVLREFPRRLSPHSDRSDGYPFPVANKFSAHSHVDADLFSSRIDLVEFFVDQLPFEYQADKPIAIPDEPGIHLLRAVGPSFGDDDEEAFLNADREGLRSMRHHAIALNLFHLTLDLLGAVVDLRNILGKGDDVAAQLLEEEFRQMVEDAPDINGQSDLFESLIQAQLRLSLKLAAAFADQAALPALGRVMGETAKLSGKTITGVLELLSAASAVGEVAERLYGVTQTSPLETAFVVVGDPFSLQVSGVDPSEAGPTDTITLELVGGVFRIENPGDHVFLLPAEAPLGTGILCPVTGIAELPNGHQKLTLLLPEELQQVSEGAQRFLVVAKGRRGESGRIFTLKRRPRVTHMGTRTGFAATDDFLGAPFPGSAVLLSGFDFGLGDGYFFGAIRATNVLAGDGGSVLVHVPRGATDGPIRIERRVSETDVRIGHSPPFQVISPPAIVSLEPPNGPVGTVVGVTVSSLPPGNPTSGGLEVLMLGGWGPVAVERFRDTLRTFVPAGTTPGPIEVSVHTPAGSATASFTVMPGLAIGSEMTVGTVTGCAGPTVSPLRLERALAMAAGTGLPVDDEDEVRNPLSGAVDALVDIDCAWEEGDFITPDLTPYVAADSGVRRENDRFRWRLGAEFADTIRVTEGSEPTAGDLELKGDSDTVLLGAFTGSLRITATNCTVTLASFKGTRLTIEGSHNRVSGTFEPLDGIHILGHQNTFSGTVQAATKDGVVVRGDFNEIHVTTLSNGGNGLVVDGGRFNRIIAFAGRNTGHGVVLRGGAQGNQVSVGTGRPFGPGVEPGSGNAGHGILITDGASHNRVVGISPIGANVGDGVRLEGPDLVGNELALLDAVENGDHGFWFGRGAVGTRIPIMMARGNRGDGFHFAGSRDTRIGSLRALENGGNGISLSDIDDGVTELQTIECRGNGGAGLHLGGTTAQLAIQGRIDSGTVGIRLLGEGVRSNRLNFAIQNCTSHGAELIGARSNHLALVVAQCGGHGTLSLQSVGNHFELQAVSNRLDGLQFADTSRANTVEGIFRHNRNGVVLTGGATRNVLREIRANANTLHGVHVTGTGTSENSIGGTMGFPVEQEPPGNGGDGLRFDDGASENTAGDGQALIVSYNHDAGVRVTGKNTVGNRILNATISSPDPGPSLPVAIVVDDLASETVLGAPAPFQRITITRGVEGVRIQGGARGTSLMNAEITGQSETGVKIGDAPNTAIGGGGGLAIVAIVPFQAGAPVAPAWGNLVHSNKVGLAIIGDLSRDTFVRGNTFFENETAIRITEAVAAVVSENWIFKNSLNGIELENAVETSIRDNRILDNTIAGVSLKAASVKNGLLRNRISGNGIGVSVSGPAARKNWLLANAISGNTGLGIALSGGANDGRAAPRIESFSSRSVIGSVDAPDGSVVDVYTDRFGDRDEGHEMIGSGRVVRGRFNASLGSPLHLPEVGRQFALNAVVTDVDLNTSEFGGFTGGQRGGGPVVFVSTRDGNPEIYLTLGLFDPPLRMTTNLAADTAPALSPDGTRIAFVSTRFGNPEICLLTLTGIEPVTRLTHDPSIEMSPSWSPDGQRIAFVSDREGNVALYTMDLDGTHIARIGNNPDPVASPSWSPDGSQLAFASGGAGKWDLWTVRSDGTGLAALLQDPAEDTQPAWSPDGHHIAFVSTRDGNEEIYVLKVSDGTLSRLTQNPSMDRDPAWFGNDFLVFTSDRDAGFELYLIPIRGGLEDRLTVGSGDNSEPHAGQP